MSHELSRSFGLPDGREVLLDTVDERGRRLTDDEAWRRYEQTGQSLGVFNSVEEADAFATSRSTSFDHDDGAIAVPATLDQDTQAFLAERGITSLSDSQYTDYKNHLAVNPSMRPSYRGMPAGQMPPPDYNSVQDMAEQSLSQSDGAQNGRSSSPPRSGSPYRIPPDAGSDVGARFARASWDTSGQPSQPMAAADNAQPVGAESSPGSGIPSIEFMIDQAYGPETELPTVGGPVSDAAVQGSPDALARLMTYGSSAGSGERMPEQSPIPTAPRTSPREISLGEQQFPQLESDDFNPLVAPEEQSPDTLPLSQVDQRTPGSPFSMNAQEYAEHIIQSVQAGQMDANSAREMLDNILQSDPRLHAQIAAYLQQFQPR